jgi:hypothetical protein
VLEIVKRETYGISELVVSQFSQADKDYDIVTEVNTTDTLHIIELVGAFWLNTCQHRLRKDGKRLRKGYWSCYL